MVSYTTIAPPARVRATSLDQHSSKDATLPRTCIWSGKIPTLRTKRHIHRVDGLVDHRVDMLIKTIDTLLRAPAVQLAAVALLAYRRETDLRTVPVMVDHALMEPSREFE